MKDKSNNWEWRDISGTDCVSNAYLTYLACILFLAYLMRISRLFFDHANSVVIVRIISNNYINNMKEKYD